MRLKKLLPWLFTLFAAFNGHAQTGDVHNWPKVELHLHLDCSLSYAVVHRIDPAITEADYRQNFIAPPRCINLADYIARAERMVALMQTREQLRLVTLDVMEQLRRDNVIYAEMRFAPLLHLQKGLTPAEVVATVDSAVEEGMQVTGVRVGLILCTLRHYSPEQSMETVKLVERFHHSHVVGFDIAGDEAGYPIDNHVAAFRYAAAHGIPCTAHAGEASGAGSVWQTLDKFQPSRIGHGVRSIEDTALLSYLRAHSILLEVCPSSNLQTNIYPTIDDHPADRLYRSGVELNINTDCRTISNTTLDREYRLLIDHFHWKKADFLACNLQAVEHAFASSTVKTALKAKLEAGYRP